MTTSLSFQNTQFDVIEKSNQFWLSSSDIAQALGYKSSRSITNIFTRNTDEFSHGMTEVLKLSTSGNYQRAIRIFSLRGAHLVAMFARTERAKDFRKWVLDVLDKETGQSQSLTLDDGQKRAIREVVELKTKNSGESHRKIYLALHRHFSVREYGDIPQSDFNEAISFLQQLNITPPLPTSPESNLPVAITRIMLYMENGQVVDSSVVPNDAFIVGRKKIPSILEYQEAFSLEDMAEIAQCAQRRVIEMAKAKVKNLSGMN